VVPLIALDGTGSMAAMVAPSTPATLAPIASLFTLVSSIGGATGVGVGERVLWWLGQSAALVGGFSDASIAASTRSFSFAAAVSPWRFSPYAASLNDV